MPEALITDVVAGSLADRAGIKPGEFLLTINGEYIYDVLDYEFATTEDHLELLIKDQQGNEKLLSITKELDADLGLLFADTVFNQMNRCQNRCQFCFVDQMPKGMRRSLYLKDDDYRFSFLFGSFITLGNLKERDWAKIEKYHLSPLYISVHATQPTVRQELVKPRRDHNIMDDMQRLADLGIEMHTQIVLCPGINDGEVLEATISDLASLMPAVRSIGIVPVGMTGHRNRLPALKPVDKQMAQRLTARGRQWQQHFRAATDEGLGFVYLADEFFIKAQEGFPMEEYYDGYPQLENGIGLCRLFLTGWESIEPRLPGQLTQAAEYIMVCGISAVPVLTPVVNRLNQIDQLKVHLHPVQNSFFGGQVTVTGLLTGKDIIASLKGCTLNGTVLLPNIVLKEGENRLLDEVTPDDIVQITGYQVQVVGTNASDLVQAMGLKSERRRKVKAPVRFMAK